MAEYQSLFTGYLNTLPPVIAMIAVAALIGWKFWLKNNADVTSDKTLLSVSGSFKQLSEAQQSRIMQQDGQITRLEKIVMELQVQLTAALAEITRLCVVLENVRSHAAFKDASTLRALREDDGNG